MNIEEVEEKLEKANQWDKITIKSDTEDFLEIQADEISYEYVGSADLDSIFGKESKESWLLSFFNDSVYTTPILARYDKDQINELLSTIDELDEIPLNASITYSDSFDAFVIDPHRYGIKLNKEELLDLVTATIDNRDSELNIEKYIEEPSMFEDDESLIAAKDMANKYLELELIYDFADRKELIDGSVLKDFIAFNKAELYFDRNQVKKYVVNIARKYDTFGRNRSFRTSTDKNITIGGGSYGWAIHRDKTTDALIEHIESNENKVIEPIYSFRDLERSTNDIGSSYVEIDLKNQMVYVYRDGQLRVKTKTVTGNVSRGKATPTGIYPLNYKERDTVLRGEDYESPVKYWMPFNYHIGLHDADLKTEFGGDIYEKNGSNGCINLPPENTKAIFDLVYPGMPVIVH